MIKYFDTLTNTRGDSLQGYRLQVTDSSGVVQDIFADAGGTRFTDGSGSTVNYATADSTGRVAFYWTPAAGQVLQTLDTTGALAKPGEEDFADQFVLSSLTGPIPQNEVTDLVSDLAAKTASADLASTDSGKGASLVSLESGGTPEDVLKADYVFTPDTAQATIDAALDVDDAVCIWQAGTYDLANLTGTGLRQRHICPTGLAVLRKNANGPIWTHTIQASDYGNSEMVLDGICFDGQGSTYTGINFKHENPCVLKRYYSRNAAAQAIVSEGRVRAYSAVGVVNTLATGASDFCWDIGVSGGISGSAVLYSYIEHPYTSVTHGGIRCIDTGNVVLVGGQIGKLTIDAGAGASGSNGGHIIGVRILGDTVVGLSNTVFSSCLFSTVNITFESGTSQCSLDMSNMTGAATITNNGNLNNVIIALDISGSPTGMLLDYGTGSNKVRYVSGVMELLNQDLYLANAQYLRTRDSGGNVQVIAGMSGSDNFQLFANNGSNNATILSGTGGIYMAPGGTSIGQWYSGGLRPQTDATSQLGTSSQKWSQVHASSGFYTGGTRVVASQQGAVPNPTGGATIDVEARTAIDTILTRLRTHGLIAT